MMIFSSSERVEGGGWRCRLIQGRPLVEIVLVGRQTNMSWWRTICAVSIPSRGSESIRLTSITTTPNEILPIISLLPAPDCGGVLRRALTSFRGEAVRDVEDKEDASKVVLITVTSVRKKTASRTYIPSLVYWNGILTLPHPSAGDPFWGACLVGSYSRITILSVIIATSNMSEQERLQGGKSGVEAL